MLAGAARTVGTQALLAQRRCRCRLECGHPGATFGAATAGLFARGMRCAVALRCWLLAGWRAIWWRRVFLAVRAPWWRLV